MSQSGAQTQRRVAQRHKIQSEIVRKQSQSVGSLIGVVIGGHLVT
jgi:hypothetical protein